MAILENMTHPLYVETANCNDVPASLPSGTGIDWSIPDHTPETILGIIAELEQLGGRIQEKVDGCWCAMSVDKHNRLVRARSRTNKPLRYAAEWRNFSVNPGFEGWQLIGELEAATTRAKHHRATREADLDFGPPPYHVYAVVNPTGDVYDGWHDVMALLFQMIPPAMLGTIKPVDEALNGEPWADFARRILEADGEGCVIRRDGECWRIKQRLDFDRYVASTVMEKDRNGRRRHKARLSICTSNGRRPRYRVAQTVVLPSGVWPRDVKGKVVTVVGSSIERATGVIRHARIVEIRDDKEGRDCRKGC